jgi:hypothetical protein
MDKNTLPLLVLVLSLIVAESGVDCADQIEINLTDAQYATTDYSRHRTLLTETATYTAQDKPGASVHQTPTDILENLKMLEVKKTAQTALLKNELTRSLKRRYHNVKTMMKDMSSDAIGFNE